MHTLLHGHHTADGFRDTIFGPSVWFHRLTVPSLITSISGRCTFTAACRSEELIDPAPNAVGAGFISFQLVQQWPEGWPDVTTITQRNAGCDAPFRLWPMSEVIFAVISH